jgi:hypothetical protein
MKQIGKIGKINQEALKINIAKYEDKSLYWCEVNLPGCMNQFGLSIAHRHERHWYRQFFKLDQMLKMLTDDRQTILACAACHQKMDYTPQLREEIFLGKRGPEEIFE